MKASKTRTIRKATINLGNGLSFEIEYRSFSPAEWDKIDQQAKGEKWQLVKELAVLLVSTGLEDEDDKPIAPTDENLQELEVPILRAMLAAIIDTTLPKKES